MGYYINTTSNGRPLLPKGKFNELIKDGGTVASGQEFVPNLICVVENLMFDAAGYCFSLKEYQDFKDITDRRKVWLTHPQAAKLSGFENS